MVYRLIAISVLVCGNARADTLVCPVTITDSSGATVMTIPCASLAVFDGSIQAGGDVPGFHFTGRGILVSDALHWGSGNSGANVAMVGAQPELEFIKNPYPDGGCKGAMNLSHSDSNHLELNTVRCDGSDPETQCAFLGTSGFECGANGGDQIGATLNSGGAVADDFRVTTNSNIEGGLRGAHSGSHLALRQEWNLWINGVLPDGGSDWQHDGDGTSRPSYAEFMGDVNGFGEGWGVYYAPVTGLQRATLTPIIKSIDGHTVEVAALKAGNVFDSFSGSASFDTTGVVTLGTKHSAASGVISQIDWAIQRPGNGTGTYTIDVWSSSSETTCTSTSTGCTESSASARSFTCSAAFDANAELRMHLNGTNCDLNPKLTANATLVH